jgi:hypothetical protein
MKTPNSIAYVAEGAIAAYSVVKIGASGGCLQADSATVKSLGLSTDIAAASGDICDVIVQGVALGKAGGTVAHGDLLTSDSAGLLVAAAPSTGVNNRIVGVALEAAVSGDIFRVAVALGSVQG